MTLLLICLECATLYKWKVKCPKSSFVVLPYIKSVSEKIARTLRRENVKVGQNIPKNKPINTLHHQFPKPKDKLELNIVVEHRGVIYKICCSNCEFTYFGQTDRALKTKILNKLICNIAQVSDRFYESLSLH